MASAELEDRLYEAFVRGYRQSGAHGAQGGSAPDTKALPYAAVIASASIESKELRRSIDACQSALAQLGVLPENEQEKLKTEARSSLDELQASTDRLLARLRSLQPAQDRPPLPASKPKPPARARNHAAGDSNMPISSLDEAMEFESSVLQQLEVSLHNHLQLEEAALAEIEQCYAPAVQEAAEEGYDLPTYAAMLAEQGAAEDAQANPGGAHAHALAEQEAAMAGMDLETYVAVLAEIEAAEMDGQGAQGVDPHEAELLEAIAHEEAAAAGMDLPTYAAALEAAVAAQQQDEQSILEAIAHEEGMALYQSELAAQQASLAGLTPHEFAYLQQAELVRQHYAQTLGLLR